MVAAPRGPVLPRAPGEHLCCSKGKAGATPNFEDAPQSRIMFPIVRPEPPLASNKPTLAQLGYHRAQTKKVLNHAREELVKEVRKAGYNALVGVSFLVCSFFWERWF
jgi:hypothetical protein